MSLRYSSCCLRGACTPLWEVQDTCAFLFCFFHSKRQVWFQSMSIVWPFITAAMKATLMDMKAQSIGQEREIREGWVTIFLLLDNHVMPCSLSRDSADWCLSFISLALIWQSTCFIVISAENPYHNSFFFPGPPHVEQNIVLALIKTKQNKWQRWQQRERLSIDHILKEIKKKTESRWRQSFFFLFFVFKKKLFCKTNSDCEAIF